MLQREPNGNWTIPNAHLLGQLQNTLTTCATKCEAVANRNFSVKIGAQDFKEDTAILNHKIVDLSERLAKFGTETLDDLDREALTAAFVKTALSIEELKKKHANIRLFDEMDRVFVKQLKEELGQIVGEVPEGYYSIYTKQLAADVRALPSFHAFCEHLRKFKTEFSTPSDPILALSFSFNDQDMAHLINELLKMATPNVRFFEDDGPKAGREIGAFLQELEDADYLLVIGSSSYGEKARSPLHSGVKSESRVIVERYNPQPKHIIQLLIEGTVATSFPSEMAHSQVGYLEATSADKLFSSIARVLERVYYYNNNPQIKVELEKLKREFSSTNANPKVLTETRSSLLDLQPRLKSYRNQGHPTRFLDPQTPYGPPNHLSLIRFNSSLPEIEKLFNELSQLLAENFQPKVEQSGAIITLLTLRSDPDRCIREISVMNPFSERIGHEGLNFLHIAVILKVNEVAQKALRLRHTEEDFKTASGWQLTHLAAVSGNRDFLSTLLGVRLKLSSANGWNELELSIFAGEIGVVEVILESFSHSESKLSYTSSLAGTLFHLIILASLKGVPPSPLFELILKYKDLFQDFQPRFLAAQSDSEHSPIAFAAEIGALQPLSYLIDIYEAYSIDLQGRELLQNAFYKAAHAEQYDAVELLFMKGFLPATTPQEFHKLMGTLSSGTKTQRQIHQLIIEALDQKHFTEYTPPNPQNQPYTAAIYQGGGMKGVFFPYADETMERCCQKRANGESRLLASQIRRIGGTSAGAIYAFLKAIGLSHEKLKEEMNRDFGQFLGTERELALKLASEDSIRSKVEETLKEVHVRLEKSFQEAEKLLEAFQGDSLWNKAKALASGLTNARSIYFEVKQAYSKLNELNSSFKGLCSGEEIEKWLTELISKENIPNFTLTPTTTLKEWGDFVKQSHGQYKHLYLAVTNLDTLQPHILNTENPRKEDEEVTVLSAVLASMAIPFVFHPRSLKYKNGHITHPTYVDGGCLANSLIQAFDQKQFAHSDRYGSPDYPVLNKEVIGFHFKASATTKFDPQSATLFSLAQRLGELYYDAERVIGDLYNRGYHRIIDLNPEEVGIGTLSFAKLPAETLDKIEKLASVSVEDFFHSKKKV